MDWNVYFVMTYLFKGLTRCVVSSIILPYDALFVAKTRFRPRFVFLSQLIYWSKQVKIGIREIPRRWLLVVKCTAWPTQPMSETQRIDFKSQSFSAGPDTSNTSLHTYLVWIPVFRSRRFIFNKACVAKRLRSEDGFCNDRFIHSFIHSF